MNSKQIFVLISAIAMLGALVATAYDNQAYAARSGQQKAHCYNTFDPFGGFETTRCYGNGGDCKAAQSSDQFTRSGCYQREF